MQFDTLYHKGSSGALYSWRVWTEGADVCTEYGQIDGKKQLARKTADAKNVDKSNATTPEEQAVAEAKSMWTHRVERKYRRTIDEAKNDEIFLPMLASEFEKRRGQKKDGHTYPCDVQPKLDGVRCLAYWEGDDVKLLSRGGKEYNCPHIVSVLRNCLRPGMVLDGELYLHGVGFQTITSWVKKLQENTRKIQYHVYDCVLLNDRDADWPTRYYALYSFFNTSYNRLDGIYLVETYEAHNEDEILRIHNKVVSKGYEGAIVRMYDDSKYQFAYRSKRLLKVKSFNDSEYEVVGYTTGKGKFADCAVWICKAGDNTFQVVSMGSMEERKRLLQEAESYVGCLLKVKYFDLTDDGIPRFPVGIGFRMEEDMS